jgi:hypothetical protein
MDRVERPKLLKWVPLYKLNDSAPALVTKFSRVDESRARFAGLSAGIPAPSSLSFIAFLMQVTSGFFLRRLASVDRQGASSLERREVVPINGGSSGAATPT